MNAVSLKKGMYCEQAVQLFQLLVSTYWAFLQRDWPTVERKGHRSELKSIPNIEVVKNYVLEHLGFIPVYFFLVVVFGNKDFPGPYRGVEKGLLILYHLLTGASMAQMGQFIPKSSFTALYSAFYSKQLERLDKTLDECFAKMFSNVKLRVVCAKNINPEEFKHVTIMIDGHDSRATYMNAENRAQYYSYKLKKSGFRTQVAMDVNGMILFVSKAAPCGSNNDGSMLGSMNLNKKVSHFDAVVLDGGYSLYIDRVLEVNHHLRRENFVTPVRKSRGINLSTDETAYNQLLGSFRSSIESRFGELGHLFHRFNGKSVIRVSDDAVFTVQFKLACVLSNMKKFVAMGQLQHVEHHTFWMQRDFDYFSGSASTRSVYQVVDTLSIADRRSHKDSMAELQQQLLNLDLTDGLEDEAAQDDHDTESMQAENQQSYEVERIIEHRDSPRGVEYRVKWKGYDNRYNRWLTSDMFDDAAIIEAYLLSQ